MPVQPYGEIPFGLRDIRLTPWTGATLGSPIDVPRIRTMEANITRDSADLEGDDVRVATHTFGTAVEGTFEAGGVNLAAIALLTGGSSTGTTGTAGAMTNTFILEGNDVDGYFKVEGQSYADDAGDVHVIIWRAKATNGPNTTFNQGEFALTTCDVTGIFDASVTPSRLYSIIQNEAPVPMPGAL